MEPTHDPRPTPADERVRRQRGWLIAAGVTIVALLAALVIVLVADDEDDDVTAGTTTTMVDDSTTTTTTEEPTTTTTEATATSTTEPTGGELSDDERTTIVWPSPDEDFRYDEPLPAVRGFADELVGFTDPVYGDFRAGDSRSGEVEVRPFENGVVTTVLVRQLSDGNWYVLAAETDEIELDQPTAGDEIDAPLTVSGEARAFEGMVSVAVYELGGTSPLGEGTVIGGGGGELAPFDGEIDYESPEAEQGVVVLSTSSGRDGGAAAATAVPVTFAASS